MTSQLQVKIPPFEQLKQRVCECGSTAFIALLDLRELPKFFSPSGVPETMSKPQAFACVACGKLMSLRPEELKHESKIIMSG